MKLGLSAASYRWVCYPCLRYDTPEFRYSERRLPYFTSVEPPADLYHPLDWLLERVDAHSLDSIYLESGWLGDERGAAEFKEKLEARRLVFFAGAEANLAATPEEWGEGRYDREVQKAEKPVYRMEKRDHGWTDSTYFARVVRAMELAATAGARAFNLVHGAPTQHNRFTKDPPIQEQIERIIHNMKTLVPVAEALGLVMTNESHMDYRVADYIQVLEAVDSPWLRHTFDFANSIAVVEDPLEAARLVARYTIATHIKDMHVQPATTMGEPAFYHAPIGSGKVPVEHILEVLQAGSPDPEGLHHCVEVCTLPHYDAEQWVAESLDWLRIQGARFWT